MSSVSYESHLKIPIFDGTNYPFWKEKMKIRLRAMDDDMWNVVQFGFTVEIPQAPLMPRRNSFRWMLKPKMKLVAISLEHNSFGIASVRLQRSCEMSSKRSMKEFQLRMKLEVIHSR